MTKKNDTLQIQIEIRFNFRCQGINYSTVFKMQVYVNILNMYVDESK